MTREEAKALGLKKYSTGKPCPQGHLAERFTRNGTCLICQLDRTRKWKSLNRDAVSNQKRSWLSRNPDARRVHEGRRRARKRNAGGVHTVEQIQGLFIRQNKKCAFCGCSIKLKYEIDHIHPLSLGGSNEITNIQLLCASCNRKKYNKHPLDFARENGKLL